MEHSTKQFSEYDYEQIFQKIFNGEGATISVDGFLAGKVGRKVELNITTTTVANDTEVFTFSESGVNLFEFTIVYTSGSRDNMLSAERTA